MIRPWCCVWLLLLFACDGPMRPAVDAGPDADGSDTQGDVEDVVDAGVDAMDIPVCISWRPETGVPPEAIIDVPDLSMGREVWEGNIPSPGIISGSQMALMFEPYQHMVEIWLVDLTTMDATRITEESVQSYPPLSIRDGRIDAVQCPGDTFEECGLFTYSLEENIWRPMVLNTSNSTHKMSFSYPSVGLGYTLFFYRTMEIETEWSMYDLRLIHHDTLEVELLVDWENLDNKDGTFAAGGRYSAWCAANTAYDAWVLWLYDSATGERTEVDTSHLGQCKELTGVDGDKVLFGTYRQIYGIFEGEVRAFTDIEFHVYDHTTGDLHTFANSPWWDQVAVGLAWPLVLYRDHGVFCYGWADAGYNSNNCSYLVIQNVESGVARPIPIPASPVDAGSLHDLYPIQVLRAPWRIVYGDYGTPDDWHTPTIHVLDLELAGYVDELGNVIPDPTYPPTSTN